MTELTGATSVTAEIQKILDKLGEPESAPTAERYLRAVYYGDIGTAKTVTAVRNMGKTFILAQDPGWKSLYNHVDDIPKEDWAKQDYKGFKHLEAVAYALYHNMPPYDKYETFVIDTFTGIQTAYVHSLVRAVKVNKDTRPQFTPKDSILALDVPLREIAGRDDYNAVLTLLAPVIRMLDRAPKNVIYVCHEKVPTEEEMQKKNSLKYIRPSLSEAVFKVVAQDADLVGRFFKTAGEYAVSFDGSDGQICAKSRIGTLNGKTIKSEQLGAHIRRWQSGELD